MRRRRLNQRSDKRRFSKTTGQHPGNTVKTVMRGGIRK